MQHPSSGTSFLRKRTGCLAVASKCLLSWPWEHQEMHPLPVGPEDLFLSLGPGPPCMNYVVGVLRKSMSSSLSPALSPGWISGLSCNFVSGTISCYFWLEHRDRPWIWLITGAHMGHSMEPAISPWLCSTSSGGAGFWPNWWRCCLACAVVSPHFSCLVQQPCSCCFWQLSAVFIFVTAVCKLLSLMKTCFRWSLTNHNMSTIVISEGK